ncbi:hypothetical protein KQI63_15885 [bacterium]|nr:hypothetical protein [bacterium]
MPDSRVALTIAGKAFTGWEIVRIRHSIDTLVGSFELSLGWLDDGGDSVPEIRAGASCKVTIDGEEVIRGYIDVTQRSVDANSRTLQVTGRGAAQDLIDCSSPLENKTLRDLTLDKLVAQLVQPFGLAVRTDSGVDLGKTFGQFTLQAAETPWEALERACRSRMVLPRSDVDGTIVLTRPGAGGQADALVYGQNVLSARRLSDMSGRYSEIKVRGETQFDLGDEIQAPVGVEGRAMDGGVPRYRPKVLVTSGLTKEYVTQRAAWEAVVRAAKGDRFEVAVKGFRMAGGDLWQPNMRTGVQIEPLGVDASLLIAARVFSQESDSGTRTTLELVRPDVFTYRPEVPEQTLLDPEGMSDE